MQLGFEMYDVTRPVMSPMSDSLPPLATLLMRPAQIISTGPIKHKHGTHTGKVAKRKVRNIAPSDLQAHTVGRERQLRGGRVLIRALQEVRRSRARVERRSLRAPDALLDLGLVEDDVAEGLIAGGTECLAARVGDEPEGDGALPGLLGIGEAAFSRASIVTLSVIVTQTMNV